MSERNISNTTVFPLMFFFEDDDRKELDWLEERNGKLFAFEAKWNPARRSRMPLGFEEAYPGTEFQVIHPENYFTVLK